MCRFLTPTSTSQIPATCWRTQLNSDTVYQETESGCTGESLSPTRLPSTPDTSVKPDLLPGLLTDRLQIGGSNNPLQSGCQQEVRVVACTSEPLAMNSRFPRPLLGSIRLPEVLTKLRKPVYSLDYLFITQDAKGYKSTAK